MNPIEIKSLSSDIQASLEHFEKFDANVKTILTGFRAKLIENPGESERVIDCVARKFGAEAALWTLRKTSGAFFKVVMVDDPERILRNRVEFYPLLQQKIVHLFATLFDLENTRRALEAVQFYEPLRLGSKSGYKLTIFFNSGQPPVSSFGDQPGLEPIQAENASDYFRQLGARSRAAETAHFVFPIELGAERFKEAGARAIVDDWASVLRIRNCGNEVPSRVVAIFEEKLGFMAKQWAKERMEPRVLEGLGEIVAISLIESCTLQ